MNWIQAKYRWLFKRCMDCGIKLSSEYDRGDVCSHCFDDFNGITIEELAGIIQATKNDKLIPHEEIEKEFLDI